MDRPLYKNLLVAVLALAVALGSQVMYVRTNDARWFLLLTIATIGAFLGFRMVNITIPGNDRASAELRTQQVLRSLRLFLLWLGLTALAITFWLRPV